MLPLGRASRPGGHEPGIPVLAASFQQGAAGRFFRRVAEDAPLPVLAEIDARVGVANVHRVANDPGQLGVPVTQEAALLGRLHGEIAHRALAGRQAQRHGNLLDDVSRLPPEVKMTPGPLRFAQERAGLLVGAGSENLPAL